jgi:hypothetical protein
VRLYEPERHEPLAACPWDEERARAFVADLARDAELGWDPERLWTAHPDDDPDGRPRTGLYFGAAGVCWALHELGRRGLAPVGAWRARVSPLIERPPDSGSPAPSWFLGDTGVRAVAGTDPDALYDRIAANVENPALEPLWGCSGTMLPALACWRSTGDERWRALWLRNARFLLDSLQPEGWWIQDLYGRVRPLLGAAHGFAGNAFALLQGLDLLDDGEGLAATVRQTLLATAVRADGLANWAPTPGGEPTLVQWCHGAPGMITALADLPGDDVEEVLSEGGELVWRAGPVRKGAGLCHGTAGNGYAFAKLWVRTGDPRWLDRARAFAMHAILQSERAREQHGMWRWSLFTGDPGLALYLADCIDGTARFPALDAPPTPA